MKDFNHEAIVDEKDGILTPFGLDVTLADLEVKMQDALHKAVDEKTQQGEPSVLAEQIEKNFSVREMSTTLALMMSHKLRQNQRMMEMMAEHNQGL